MSATISDFCQRWCLWWIFWNMSAASFASCRRRSSLEAYLSSFFLCTFPQSQLLSLFLSSHPHIWTLWLMLGLCTTPYLCLHTWLVASQSTSLACLLSQTWCSSEIFVEGLQVRGFSLYHLLSGSDTFSLASDHLCGCSLDGVMAEWGHHFVRHTAVLGNKLESTSQGVI